MARGKGIPYFEIEDRNPFHFTQRKIKAHVCIRFIALKIYKELKRVLKATSIGMNVDKVLALAETVITIQVRLPRSKDTSGKTMLMARHQRIARLFDENFWETH